MKFNAEGDRLWATYFGEDLDDGNRSALTLQNDKIVLTGVTNSVIGIAFGNPFDMGST